MMFQVFTSTALVRGTQGPRGEEHSAFLLPSSGMRGFTVSTRTSGVPIA